MKNFEKFLDMKPTGEPSLIELAKKYVVVCRSRSSENDNKIRSSGNSNRGHHGNRGNHGNHFGKKSRGKKQKGRN